MWHLLTRQLSSNAVKIQSPKTAFNTSFVKSYSKEPDHGRQLGGYEYRDELESAGFRSKWRAPLMERDWFWKSKLSLFSSKVFAGGLTKYNPLNWKHFSWRIWYGGHAKEKLKYDQRYIKDRLVILGPNLAAAHFVVYRDGAVKFEKGDWIKDDKKKNREYFDQLPTRFDPNYILEAVDFSKSLIVYEGLVNLDRLPGLKWISFSKCPLFDNWCLDRLSGEHGEHLEHLDISYTLVSHTGLSALYRFKKLKTLKVEGLSRTPEFVLTCIELQKDFPNLTIEGISMELLDEELKSKQKAKSEDEPAKLSLSSS